MKNILFILLLSIGLLFASSCNSSKQPADTAEQNPTTANAPKLLSVAAFAQQLVNTPNAVLIDLRTPEEITETGRIENATNLDFNSPNFDTELAKLDKTKPTMVYCARGGRSGQAAKKMVEMGFSNVSDLDGGMMAWQGNKMPTNK